MARRSEPYPELGEGVSPDPRRGPDVSLTGRRRQTLALQLGKCHSESARGREQAVVVAGQLHGLTLPADEVDGREMKRVEGANGNRKGLLREPRPAVSTPPASVARSTFAQRR